MFSLPRAVQCALLVSAFFGSAHAGAAEPSASFKAACESKLPRSSIVVTSEPSEVTYIFNRGVQDLTKRSPAYAKSSTQTTLGLTESKFQLESRWSGEMLQDPRSRLACTRPAIQVTVKVGPQVVSIGREFEREGCAFWEIAEHELRHVRANLERVEYVAEKLEQELRSSFGNRVFYGSSDELRNAFSSTLKAEWLPWGKSLYEGVKVAHQAIDSPEEYARSSTMCDGEVGKALAMHRAR